MVARHMSAKGPGRTLQEVGALFEVTRERIRQVCEAMEQVMHETPPVTPALDRVLRATARIAPCSLDEVNEQLARFIGEGTGIEALIAWAETLGRQNLVVRCGQARLRLRGHLMNVKMVVLAGAGEWMAAALRHASRDCSVMGCTTVMRVAGQLSLKEGIAPGQEALETTLSEGTGFRWLDRESGWFSLGDSTSSSAATRVRKIMSVAHEAVGADQIGAAFASDDMWLYREEKRAFAIPPPHVLRELFLGWDFLSVVQKGRFAPRTELDPEGLLSPPERVTIKVVEAHGGVACRFEVKAAIMSTLGTTDMAVAAMLGSSPVILKLEHGLYALRGRRVGDAALDAARMRLREKNQSLAVHRPWLGPNEFLLRVTEAVLRNEQYSIPTRYRQKLFARPVEVFDEAGAPLGVARANRSGALAGINKLLPALKAGDHIHVRIVGEAIGVGVREGLDEAEAGLSAEPDDEGVVRIEDVTSLAAAS